MTLMNVCLAHPVRTIVSTHQAPTPVSAETVRRMRCIARVCASPGAGLIMCGAMDSVSCSAVMDTRLWVVSVSGCARRGQWRGMVSVSQCAHQAHVMDTVSVTATMTSISVSVRRDTVGTSASVAQASDIMMASVWTLMSVTSCSPAPSCVTTPRDHTSATVRMVSSRFPAAKMCAKILMNAI